MKTLEPPKNEFKPRQNIEAKRETPIKKVERLIAEIDARSPISHLMQSEDPPQHHDSSDLNALLYMQNVYGMQAMRNASALQGLGQSATNQSQLDAISRGLARQQSIAQAQSTSSLLGAAMAGVLFPWWKP